MVKIAAVIVLLALGVIVLIANGQNASGHKGHIPPESNKPMAQMPGMQMPGMQMPGMEMAPAEPNTGGPRAPEGLSTVTIAPAVQQRIGVTVGKAAITPLVMRIRTVGIVRPNETKVAHIHLKTEGWVQKLFVSFTGQNVKAGEPLLSIYSPAFFAAQREFLVALQAAKTTPSPDTQMVVDATRTRLQLWDVPEGEIESLEKTGKVLKDLILRTPIDGTVLEKKAFAGQYVAPQDELYLVGDLATVWVQAKVYEYELPHVALNMPVTVTLPAFPEREFAGRIAFLDPTVEEPARTVQVRVELPNGNSQFRPGMFATVLLSHDMGQGLTVPSSAVIRTGRRDIVYRVQAQGQFVPVEVTVNPLPFEDRFQVLSGLQAGDVVVTSANFLIDSESRLRAGAAAMAGMPGMEGMEMGQGSTPATGKPSMSGGQGGSRGSP